MIIDTAAGVLGRDDPRPVQPSSLFPLFSVTKGVTAGMVHWLADKGYNSWVNMCGLTHNTSLSKKIFLYRLVCELRLFNTY